MVRRSFALMAVVALAVWIMPVSADDTKPSTHEGKVVKAEAGKLVMTDKNGKNMHTHVVPATAKVTCDGKAAKLEDLKAGMPVKVTTEKQGEKLVVTSVEAKKAD